MAHELGQFDHMMAVKEVPWHGLGTILPDLATAKEAIEAAHLDWEVHKRPLRYTYQNEDGTFSPYTVPRSYTTVRSDTRQSLGIVGENYVPLQNREAFQFFDKVTQDPGGPKYVTAGSLRNGLKVWILARLPNFIEVTDQDVVQLYLLLSNTHDGSRQVEMLYTPIRVVCANTLSLALSDRKNSRFRFRHVGNFADRIASAQDVLGIVRHDTETLTEAIDAMKKYEPSRDEVKDVVEKLFTPPSGRAEKTVQNERLRGRIIEIFDGHETVSMPGVRGTAWGLYNSITYYADHERPARPSVHENARAERVMSNWYGKASNIKADALTTILEMVSK